MIFEISTSSGQPPPQPATWNDSKREYHIEISTLEQLLALAESVDEEIIISSPNCLEIYDTYRE